MSASGSKIELSDRIETYLRTGENYFKNNVGKTYRDAVDAWYEEEARKKEPSYTKSIAPQFEYNQFIRDFFADPNNQGKSREEAIEAWNEIKQLPGSNKYVRTGTTSPR